jgi:hypothetical protein
LEYDPHRENAWRIRYRRTNHDPRYYYVAVHFGQRDWLDAPDALEISRRGFAQRIRVRQAEAGDFSWLQPIPGPPGLALEPDETILLDLRGVTLREVSRGGLFIRPNRGKVVDSGTCCVTTQRLHLLGQHLYWVHDLGVVERALYNDQYWLAIVHDSGRWLQYTGAYSEGQVDPQLVVTMVDYLALHTAG